jgi:hypothetical protein
MIDVTTEKLVAMLQCAGIIGNPCDEWQVRDIEKQLRVELPPAYKAFLLLAGQGFEPFEGSHYALEDDLAELQRAGRRISHKDRADLSSEAFVFFIHQGVAVRFFLLDSSDDPAVYEYVEHSPPAKQLAPRFSDFLLDKFRQSEELKSRRRR